MDVKNRSCFRQENRKSMRAGLGGLEVAWCRAGCDSLAVSLAFAALGEFRGGGGRLPIDLKARREWVSMGLVCAGKL